MHASTASDPRGTGAVFSFTDQNMEWVSVAVQAGGAIAVCGMFLWFLKQKQIADDKSRAEFLQHLSDKDASAQKAMDTQMQYLRDRDAQSKEIAQTGHKALTQISTEVRQLATLISARTG